MEENRIKIKETKVLSDDYYLLNKVSFDYKKDNGEWETQIREVYDKGSASAILLYNPESKKIILTKQFRLPVYLNEGNKNGMSVEVCAGLLDGDTPEDCIRKEALEETGYKISEVKKVFEAYMTPGTVMEKVHYFIAEYDSSMKVTEGGGLESEHEEIEVLELDFQEAFDMIATYEIMDGKTIMLLQHAKIYGLV